MTTEPICLCEVCRIVGGRSYGKGEMPPQVGVVPGGPPVEPGTPETGGQVRPLRAGEKPMVDNSQEQRPKSSQ